MKNRTYLASIFVAAALAGCGGKSKGDTTPPAGDHDGHTDGDSHTAIPDAAVDDPPATPDVTPEPEPDPHAVLKATELAAYEAAKPVFATYCGGCHVQGGAKATTKTLGHVDMTSYPFGGHHVDTITTTIGHVLGIDGAKPTMPKGKPGSVKGTELALIEAWIEAYNAADDGGAHAEGEGHDAHGNHH